MQAAGKAEAFDPLDVPFLQGIDHYSWTDTAKFGVVMLFIGWLLNILMSETYLRFLGYTPNGVFGLF